MFRVTRRYTFAASHRLHSSQLPDEENRRIYGKCNNPYGHGHNYFLEVTARGPADETTGIAAPLAALDSLVRREVLLPFDHRNLNTDSDAFHEAVPTTENLAVEIARRLKRNWRSAFPGEWPILEKIRIEETTRNIFEIKADEIE
ncbi:MAG TPA: 6-carboxytetrahydropterin synthase [Bryobacteraceae bacterium]|nr:6-carboxytetrahydropterin synthase [Bryobacteraceae bacterium]